MENIDLYLKNLTGKDEIKANEAARYLIDSADVELFKKLIEKTDYLFDFVRNNVIQRIEKAVNECNFKNIIKFFNVYSSYYDDLFAFILSKNADEDLTDEIYELLESGSNAQKAYAAKYFCYIPDTIAADLLNQYSFSDDESLSFNSAEALGQMNDEASFVLALDYLKSEDDFDRLKAVKFFCAYGKNYPLNEIFDAMKISKMPENIAGQIPYMQSLINLLDDEKTRQNTLLAVDYIVSGLGEILPLSDIFQFEIYDLVEYLIKINKNENEYSGEISATLLKLYSKFSLFTENQEYIFDETKDVKNEVSSIFNLLKKQSDDFWSVQKYHLLKELDKDKERVIFALSVVSEYSILEAVDSIKNILAASNDEIILCEALSTLKSMNCLQANDVASVSNKIQNPNIKAIIENFI